MADTVKLSWTDTTHEIEIDGSQVEYVLDKTITKIPLPVLKQIVTGTTDGTTANKLVDSTKTFTSVAYVGMMVFNKTDTTFALVTAVDDATTLSISADIMISGEEYELWTTPMMNIIDLKQINEAFTITGSLSGIDSTDNFIKLVGLAYNTDSNPIRFTWRSRVFDDCWIRGLSIKDIMSISGTTVSGESQIFDSGQVSDDSITYSIIITLIRGKKVA